MNQFYSKNKNTLNGIIEVPGDKSISQRILILGSMAIGTTKVKGISCSEDVNNLIKNLKSLGVEIIKNKDLIAISGVGIGGLNPTKNKLYMGNSGTATRLMLGILCNQNFKVNIYLSNSNDFDLLNNFLTDSNDKNSLFVFFQKNGKLISFDFSNNYKISDFSKLDKLFHSKKIDYSLEFQ